MKAFFLATVLIVSAAPLSFAVAQGPPSDSPGSSPKDKTFEDKFRSDEIERVRRDATTIEYRPSAARFPQIKEDFERIQLINTELVKAGAFISTVDLPHISEAAGEIRKRAIRLRSNLFPSAPAIAAKHAGQQNDDGNDLKVLLAALDKAITVFVHNPIFLNTRVVNPQDSTKAEKWLQKIIEVSRRTKTTADRSSDRKSHQLVKP